ncbi:hypothetical protein DITRI_Ditri01bG0006000 [Diplodiscus trichospermus]
MKLWLVLRSYGVPNLRNFLRSHVKMAKLFQHLVECDQRFEVVAPRNFAMVCFRVLPTALEKKQIGFEKSDYQTRHLDEENANEFNRKLLESVNASGEVYMTHTVVEGIYVIRFAVGASLTEDKHVIKAWKVVQETANAILTTMYNI